MATIALELDKLVDSMEAEMRDTGTVSTEAGERLRELRLRFERVLERGGD
jgi:ElaB/YqjD/DUF883 family membrane-anchored ribosome-binding protein